MFLHKSGYLPLLAAYLPEGVSTVLKLEDVNEPDDNKPSDTYTLDLSSDNAVVSSETFNTLLEENKTNYLESLALHL